MKYYQYERQSSDFGKDSDRRSYKFGREQLYLLLLLFVAGTVIDIWFNHHQRSWQSPRTHLGVSQQVSTNSSPHSPFPLAEF
jgi:hypothetical protein